LTPTESKDDRTARADADAAAATKELAAKKARRAGPARPRKPRASRPPQRMMIVWSVGVPGLVPVKTFAYAERAAADADAERRGKGCVVRPVKVPMEVPKAAI